MPNNSVDLILTDPPYPAEFLPLWKDLSTFANRVLKPSAFLVAYSGEMYLPKVIEHLQTELSYYWCFCLKHGGSTQIVNGRNVICGWKPLLVFQKAPFKMLTTFPTDVIEGSGREKSLHEWQQGVDELLPLIKSFSKEGDLIVDPFAGSGTMGVAAKNMRRNFILIEIDSHYYEIAKERISKVPDRIISLKSFENYSLENYA